MISKKYGKRHRDGETIVPPKGWVLLAEGSPVPHAHREYIENYGGGWAGWAAPRRCHSTMTPMTAQVWGSVRAIAVPEEASAD
ncbi:hypothetical protein [Stenotrophomonas phage A1432]|uniref:Uncharacterized protein n=1 Tax=Stenotrophomonas phage A1432 TaxID=2930315 RepID=A0A9E7N180_9CAUD|nr:hypothetical protein P9A45_gp28 [Stenotrophomonas phage A1432]UTC28002.1 hypothetical protein [Stenotrophomonas phage A1432]